MLDFLITKTPLVFLTQSFWRDEAFSYLMAHQSLWQIFVSTAKDFSPPLYYLILNLWMNLFGTSEIVLRLMSLLFFYATIYVLDHILVDVLKIGSKWRIAYLLLVAINPFLIYYGYEARMYSMSAFLITLSWYGLLTGKKKLHIIASILGLYTHYFTALALLSQYIYVHLQAKHRSFYKTFAVIGVFFAPWVLFTLIFHGSSDSSFWILKPTLSLIKLMPGIILTGFEGPFQAYSTPLLGLTILSYGAVIIALSSMRHQGDKKKTATYLLLWAFLPALISLIISLIQPLFLPRYFIFSAIGMSLLLVYSLEQLKPPVRTVAFTLIIVFLFHYNAIQIVHRAKGDVRSLVNNLHKIMSPEDVIYVESDLDFHTVQYYFDPEKVFIYRKTYQEIPQYVGKVLIPNSHVVSTLPQFPKKAYIIRSNLTYDIQSMN